MNPSAAIPFLDLVTPHVELEREFTEVFRQTIRSAMFIGGPVVENFERDFATFSEARYCVGVNSGTDALRFAFMAAGIGDGDNVVTVPNSFIATSEAISQSGAVPEFVDIDERTYNIDPKKLRAFLENDCVADKDSGRRISKRTGRSVASVVAVHLYGQMADMDAVEDIAEEFNLIVIEDACQAHGAEYYSRRDKTWKTAGSIGRAAAFSFYPGKNLGACGEGGAVTTNDEDLARKIRMIRDHGQAKKYYHDIEGYNGRLDALQAGLLRIKLGHLVRWNHQRRKCAALYNRLLASFGDSIITPHEPSWSRAVYHLYVVRHSDRQGLQAHLASAGVGTAIHYPIPLHLQNAYTHLGYREGDFPITEKVAAEILSLPMFPQLQPQQQYGVVDAIAQFENKEPAVLTAAGAKAGVGNLSV
jgi:dTDP-4-amino-4,6-dideoxygalactose transaminase